MGRSDSEYEILRATECYLRKMGSYVKEKIGIQEFGMHTVMTNVKGCLKKQEEEDGAVGIYAMASSFWYLYELLFHLTSPEVNIPVTAVGVGPVTPVDIRKASQLRKPTVLAFEVDVTPKAALLAQNLGVKIICGDSVENLCQQLKDYINELGEEEVPESVVEAESVEAVSPCLLAILPKSVVNKEDPIVVGVYVIEGLVKVGTPLCIPNRAFVSIGRVAWIQKDQRPVEVAKEGDKVIIKIVAADPKTQQGRDFDVADVFVSRTSRVIDWVKGEKILD